MDKLAIAHRALRGEGSEVTKAPWALPASGMLGGNSESGVAPIYLFPVPVVTLALLMRWWRLRTPRFYAVIAFVFGLGFFGGVSWIYSALHEFGRTQAPVALVVVMLFTAFFQIPRPSNLEDADVQFTACRKKGGFIDSLPIRYNQPRWVDEFLANAPSGSPAYASYFNRIVSGPSYEAGRARPAR